MKATSRRRKGAVMTTIKKALGRPQWPQGAWPSRVHWWRQEHDIDDGREASMSQSPGTCYMLAGPHSSGLLR